MNTLITATLMGFTLALAGCSREEAREAGNDVEAAADKVAAETKEAVNSPEMKEVGSEIKEAAGDVGTVVKEAAQGAASGAREGMAKVEGDGHDDHAEPAKK